MSHGSPGQGAVKICVHSVTWGSRPLSLHQKMSQPVHQLQLVAMFALVNYICSASSKLRPREDFKGEIVMPCCTVNILLTCIEMYLAYGMLQLE